MGPVVLAIAPIFLLIFLGYGLRRARILSDGFWQPAERLIYFILFPALLLTTLAGAELGNLPIAPMAAALIAAIVLVAGAVLVMRPWLRLTGPAFTSVFQGVVRQNTYIGLAVAFAVFAVDGLAVAAVAVAVIVPLVNLLSVGVLARHGERGHASLLGAARLVAQNPLIIACAIGIVLNASGIRLPVVLGPLLEILARAALPLGLLAVGGGLDIGAARAAGGSVALATGLRLTVLPVVTAFTCSLFGVGHLAAFVAILFNGTPASPTSYILARQIGGDAQLMAGIVTVQTALALFTLPVALALLP